MKQPVLSMKRFPEKKSRGLLKATSLGDGKTYSLKDTVFDEVGDPIQVQNLITREQVQAKIDAENARHQEIISGLSTILQTFDEADGVEV